ncbi:hypothetical protein OGH69_16540 [Flavobacterium sp. MFBS3-15]|uniref:hypothetical protein n=1 Tax=Flavobacterium sp. MFBS3-15 TaxID=2989816 RepID=UPI002236846A|nr:hypothetical protein [Flavobacterium sp. MFBS3-15]MCW4470581.1 hypothetical protein [Flavobacterium sp. MFBS3-15]
MVPGACASTIPALFTVATAGLEDDHAGFGACCPEPSKSIVVPTQSALAPVITGRAFTVIVALPEAVSSIASADESMTL